MTYGYRACILACRLALALASGASCRQIVDFEPHSPRDAGALLREPDGSHDASTDAGTLFDPKPHLAGPECTRCIEESCPKESAACVADEWCSRWVEGRRALDRPVIAAPDFYGELLDNWWAAEHGEMVPNGQPLNEFDACVANRCSTACELGRDFSCVDRFAWPQTFPKQIELRFRIRDPFRPTVNQDGWRVRACARQILCEPPLGDGMTQDGGFATLGIDLSLAPGVRLPEFFGFLLLDGGTEYPPIQFDQSSPYFDHDFYPTNVVTSELIRASAENVGIPYDETRGLLQITPWDCSQAVAAGVTVEVWNADEAGYHLCGDDCRPLYPGDNALPDRTREDFSSNSLGPASAYADPGDVMVVMRDTKTRLPLGVLRPVTIRAGFVHMIALYPAPAGGLKDLPADAR